MKQRLLMKHQLRAILSLFLLFVSSLVMALDARVDRTTLPKNETLQLELSGSFSAFNLSIDLSPLEKDFRVLDNRRSTNMQYINGNFEAKTTLTVTLEPKRSGLLTIPAITIEDETSAPIELKVTDAVNSISGDPNQAPPVDIEVSLDTTDTWVQAQVLLKIKLYQSVKLFNLELQGVKELQQLGLSIEKIGDNTTYQSKRHNINYQVTELNYLIFSDNPGSLTLPEFIFEGQVPLRNSRYGKRVEARSEPITLTFKDVPKDYPSATWIPAKGLQISDDLAETIEIKQGESLNRNLIMSVYGQEAAVIPDVPQLQSDLINVYGDAPELNNQMTQEGITGVRMDNIALITKQPGTLTLPAIEIPWFNVETGKTEYARLPERTINILPDASQISNVPEPVQPNVPLQTPALEAPESHATINETHPTEVSQGPPLLTKILIITLFITVIAQGFTILKLMKKLKEKEQKPLTENKPVNESSWDQPLPTDFVACFRLIQKALQDNNMSIEALPEHAQTLIDQFRMNNYGSENAGNDVSFTNEEREKLRLLLKEFFDSQTRQAQGPSLYPE